MAVSFTVKGTQGLGIVTRIPLRLSRTTQCNIVYYSREQFGNLSEPATLILSINYV